MCVDLEGHTRYYYANAEVIISAGALQTPKILMNSGIGPKSTLDAFNIPKRVINNIIGQKIRNHQQFVMTYFSPAMIHANFFIFPIALEQYSITQNGLLGTTNQSSLSIKVNPSHPINDVAFSLAVTGSFSALLPLTAYSQNFSIKIGLTYQLYANGTVNLTSSDPLSASEFVLNLFAVDEDVDTVARAILVIREAMRFFPNATEEFPGPQVSTVEDLKPIIKSSTSASCHFYGSVPIGETADSPLDLRMRVRGVKNLRVVDTSVIPGQVNQLGMQQTATVMGVKGALMIIEDNE